MRNFRYQAGQTLIETMVAILILSMGLGAAASLANYAFSSSSNIVKQVIAMGLAREGVEAVKNMRDTNWLKDSLASDCYSFETGAADALCYRDWQKPPSGYDIDPPSSASPKYAELSFDSGSATFWELNYQNNNYTLNYDATGTDGLYSPNSAGSPSGYFRRILIAEDATGPFAEDGVGPRLTVTSEVWWSDKRCPTAAVSAPPTTGSCKIKLQMYLTNWKNY